MRFLHFFWFFWAGFNRHRVDNRVNASQPSLKILWVIEQAIEPYCVCLYKEKWDIFCIFFVICCVCISHFESLTVLLSPHAVCSLCSAFIYILYLLILFIRWSSICRGTKTTLHCSARSDHKNNECKQKNLPLKNLLQKASKGFELRIMFRMPCFAFQFHFIYYFFNKIHFTFRL